MATLFLVSRIGTSRASGASDVIGAEAGHFDEVLIGFAQNQSLERRRQTVSRFIATPGGRWFWKRYAGDYPSEFQAFIDQILRDADSSAQ